MRVLVCPDKFKGSLSAAEVAGAIGAGLESAGVDPVLLPLADGGDGSVAAALHAGFTAHPVEVLGASGRPVPATFAHDGRTAVVEVAGTCGLATLDPGTRAPMTASSHGVGQAITAALTSGAERLVLALGGSASTDGGAGMLAALGARFHDAAGAEVTPCGLTLTDITTADVTGLPDLSGIDLVVATDVTNPLLGPDGAAPVFAPQKGATAHQVRRLEAGLERLVHVLGDVRPGNAAGLAAAAGAGAAGGIGFAAMWLGARPVSGAEYFLDLLGFDDALEHCQAAVLGEGSMDAQTLWGKLPAVIARRAAPRPVYAITGRSTLDREERGRLGIRRLWALRDMTTADPSTDPALSLRLIREAATQLGLHLRSEAAIRQ